MLKNPVVLGAAGVFIVLVVLVMTDTFEVRWGGFAAAAAVAAVIVYTRRHG